MASSSSSRNWRYNVFTSFHGPDVRKTFLSHLRKQFSYKGISMFNDEGIERSQVIAPALTQAISESRISIVVLSKNYASSSWCLDELVEILKCREDIGQIVMTVFYGVDPSDVRKQTGDFGRVFNETCSCKSGEERQRWSQALSDAGNIAGEHFLNWDNEAEMIEKIAKDVLDKLNVTPSRDFDGMVGLKAHLWKMEYILDLDYDGVKVVAITGPAGIGKTTIARALHSRLSNRFQLACFVDNLTGSYHSGFDEYGLKLHLQQQFLSKILNHDGLRIYHLGAVKENLCNQKVLIILDDVKNLHQLETLANETWFGRGSRIVVTTENKELLQQHGINNTYHVGFPSEEEASEILCSYAFTQNSPLHGFKEFFRRITKLCGKLPLALRMVGSSLRGKKEDEWKDMVNRLESIIDPKIEDVLRIGYESLAENEQTLFLHIAVFFNHEHSDYVKAMFPDLDVKCGLKILVYRSLIEIYTLNGERIGMHKLLQQMAKQVIKKQELSKHQILMDTHETCDVLENGTGTQAVSGILFDVSGIDEVSINKRAFKRMCNLRFLKVYKSRNYGNTIIHIPTEMEFLCRLRLLDWGGYPGKCLPPAFHPENLVKLCMQKSQLEHLWQGTQKLTNLKQMDLSFSFHLKELPDLSNATNLEELKLRSCKSLVEVPSSFSHLHKLQKLVMEECVNLKYIPSQLNLASLELINMRGCKKLRKFSFISTNFRDVDIQYTKMEDVPALMRLWSRLELLRISTIRNKKGLFTYLPTTLTTLSLSYSDIERIPDCIKALHQLKWLFLIGCRRLASLPELPRLLKYLHAENCESMETVFFPLIHKSNAYVDFSNCLKLNQQARREMIKSSFSHGRQTIIPGREMPAKFDQRARGFILTIPLNGNVPLSSLCELQVCLVFSPNHQFSKCNGNIVHILWCYRFGNSKSIALNICLTPNYEAPHLITFPYDLLSINPSEVSREKIVLKFSCTGMSSEFKDCCLDIFKCGAYFKTNETIEESCSSEVEDGMLSVVGPTTLYDDSINESSEALYISTAASYVFSKKLKNLKHDIRKLGRKYLSSIEQKAKEALEELCTKQNANLMNPSPALMQDEIKAYERWVIISDAEEKFLKQRSKIHWLKVGDKNNRYFHSALKSRRQMNTIKEVLCRDGSLVSTRDAIKQEAEGFFSDFLNYIPEDYDEVSHERIVDLLSYQISDGEKSALIREVTEDEIKEVLFRMPDNKSPGPDGYTSEFYKASWNILGKDFTIAVQSFFQKGFLPKGINSTILALIPKKDKALEIKDYRPISCCNVIYKVISKILANRLKVLLPGFISSNQSAFVRDRLLIENVLLASELVRDYHKETISQRCAIKFDISKAFDSIQWSFIMKIFQALGFPEKYMHWIYLCISTASFSVQVNGELAGYFQSKRGLRQGCALSPYLFVMGMNVLSKLLDKAAQNQVFGFHPGCKNLQVTHLSFADDILVFTDGSKRSIEGVLSVFDNFAVMSGLRISVEKSTLYLAGVSANIREDFKTQFPFDSGTLPVKYLGLPLMTKRMRVRDYTPLIEKIRCKIQSWKTRFLSFAGRLNLITSVINGITGFWLAAFRLPKGCITKIEKICSAFLWSGPELNGRKIKIVWDDVCKKKEEGGLGLRRLNEVNVVLCLKLIWRILAKKSLWTDWVQQYIIQEGSFWQSGEQNSRGSWIWKKLLKYRDVAQDFHQVSVGNGVGTYFWFDKWSSMGRLWTVVGSRGTIDMGIPKHYTIAEIPYTRRRRNHRTSTLNQIEEELAKYNRECPNSDKHLWRTSQGNFRNKFSSCDTWNQLRIEKPKISWYKAIWFKHNTPKFAFIAWVAMHNRLSTGDRMRNWRGNINGDCVLCQRGTETVRHLFFECDYSAEIWSSLMQRILGNAYSNDWSTLIRLMTDGTRNKALKFLLCYGFQSSLYLIWRERNRRRHGENPLPKDSLINAIASTIKNRINSIRREDSYLEEAMEIWFRARLV